MYYYCLGNLEVELVFFWYNGLGLIKDEWSINFVINCQVDNVVVFSNLGIFVIFLFKFDNDKDKNDFFVIEFFWVVFLCYFEWLLFF